MAELIKMYEATSAGAKVDDDGATALLTLDTVQGRIAVHLPRRVLEMLQSQIVRELERVKRPARNLKDDEHH